MLDERFIGSDAEFAGYVRISGKLLYLDTTNDASISLSTSNSIDIINLTGDLSLIADNILIDSNLTNSTGLIKYTSDLSGSFDSLTLITKGYLVDYVQTIVDQQNALSELIDVQIPSGEPLADEFLYFDNAIGKWANIELPTSFNITASKNSIVTDIYLYHNGIAMSVSPFIVPADCYLKYLSASCNTISTWDAEVHVNGVFVPGAILNIVSSKKAYIKFSTPIQFNAGDEVQLYCMGMSIDKPKINAMFVTKPL